MFGIEQHGSETCELLPTSRFILVRVPLRVTGEGQMQEANSRYRIDSFLGREAKLLLRGRQETTITFRIPEELFRPREWLTLEVYVKSKEGEEKILWAKRYEVGRRGLAPRLQPIVELSEEPPKQK